MSNNAKIGAHLSASGSIYKSINDAMLINANAVQIFTSPPMRWNIDKTISEKNIEGWIKAGGKDFCVISHSSYLINLASNDPILNKKSIDSLISEIRRCDILGIRYIVIHGGSRKDNERNKALNIYRDSVIKVLEATHDSKTILLIENSTPSKNDTKLATSINDLHKMTKGIGERIGYCIDIGHLFAGGLDLDSKNDINQFFIELVSGEFINKVKALHISNTMLPKGSLRDRHASLEEGFISKKGFYNIMNCEIVKDSIKIIETPNVDLYEKEINILKGLISKK